MTKRKDTPIDLFRKSAWTLRNEGVSSLTRKTKNYIALQTTKKGNGIAKDILFINGCGLPHPQRYRVDHQIEQLESCGLTVEKVFYENVDLSQIKFYRGFVFFRCPITDEIEEFIKKAHYFNKTCFFDIDDLVINTKYTNQIPFVAAMEKEDKENYDDGVIRMEKTLKLCDYLITSTPALARELKKNYDKEVLTNRNVASEMMAKLSFVVFAKSPVSPSTITSLKAPKFEARVGVFTSAASVHLFSDFASLKIVSSSGARFKSSPAIISGSFFQSVNFFLMIRFSKGLKSSGTSRIPIISR